MKSELFSVLRYYLPVHSVPIYTKGEKQCFTRIKTIALNYQLSLILQCSALMGEGKQFHLTIFLDEAVKLLTLLSLGPGPHLCNILCDKTGSIHKAQTLPKTTEVNGQKNWGTSEEYRQMGTGIRDR